MRAGFSAENAAKQANAQQQQQHHEAAAASPSSSTAVDGARSNRVRLAALRVDQQAVAVAAAVAAGELVGNKQASLKKKNKKSKTKRKKKNKKKKKKKAKKRKRKGARGKQSRSGGESSDGGGRTTTDGESETDHDDSDGDDSDDDDDDDDAEGLAMVGIPQHLKGKYLFGSALRSMLAAQPSLTDVQRRTILEAAFGEFDKDVLAAGGDGDVDSAAVIADGGKGVAAAGREGGGGGGRGGSGGRGEQRGTVAVGDDDDDDDDGGGGGGLGGGGAAAADDVLDRKAKQLADRATRELADFRIFKVAMQLVAYVQSGAYVRMCVEVRGLRACAHVVGGVIGMLCDGTPHSLVVGVSIRPSLLRFYRSRERACFLRVYIHTCMAGRDLEVHRNPHGKFASDCMLRTELDQMKLPTLDIRRR